MARSGIYKSEVVKARQNLMALGRYPSIDAVRIELGNTGSKLTIHKYLKEIEEEEGAKSGSNGKNGTAGTQIAISEALQDLVGRLASRLLDESDARIAEVTAQHTQAVQQLNDAITALQSDVATTRKQLERTQATLADEEDLHQKTSESLRNTTLERTKLAQEVGDCRERLAAEERHRLSLEEKHQHARESLEHFRQSAKEQRDQEHRKHDQEVQFLQSELRNLNKAIALKQHEVTTAHQDSARLLTELTHTQSGLHTAQETVRSLKQENSQLIHAQKAADAMTKSLAQQQLQTQTLAELNAGLTAKTGDLSTLNQQLALELASAKSAVAAQQAIVDSILLRFSGGAVESKG
jgi:chromosome segregation ATPase